jgi:hypothetical protein
MSTQRENDLTELAKQAGGRDFLINKNSSIYQGICFCIEETNSIDKSELAKFAELIEAKQAALAQQGEAVYQINIAHGLWEDVKPEHIDELKPHIEWRVLFTHPQESQDAKLVEMKSLLQYADSALNGQNKVWSDMYLAYLAKVKGE